MKLKKISKKYIFVTISKTMIIFLLICLFVFMPSVTFITKKRADYISEKMFGNKAEYQGIITLWNVDTFEGGVSSRAGFLEKLAVLFEGKNKGAFIKVENLKVDEMIAKLKQGIYPNMFSFGMGLSKYLSEKMINLPQKIGEKLKNNYFASGLDGGNFKAAPWSSGGYVLISTVNKIEQASMEPTKDLKSIAFSLSYDKKNKKNIVHVNSLTFGKNDYVDAIDVFSRCFVDRSIFEEVNKGSVDKNYNSQTPYEAYYSFVINKSSVLLGTQRDVFRMENRYMAGLESQVIYQPLAEYTDLVSYISVIDGDESIKNVCLDFIGFLLSEGSQKSLKNIGLLGVTNADIYDDGFMGLMEDAINDQTTIKNVF